MKTLIKRMEKIEKKLNQLEGWLSLKHMGRDFLVLELSIIISMLISTILLVIIISFATGSSEPQQVIETAEKTSGYMGWIFLIGLQFLVIYYYRKGKSNANKVKKDIIENFEEVSRE